MGANLPRHGASRLCDTQPRRDAPLHEAAWLGSLNHFRYRMPVCTAQFGHFGPISTTKGV